MNTVHILQLWPLAAHSTAVWRPHGLKPSANVTCFFCCKGWNKVLFREQHQKDLYNKVQCLKTQYVVEVGKDQPASTENVV